MEWFSDVVMGMDAQGVPPEGFDVPFVTDTNSDMLCNLCGGLVFFAHYLIGKYSKCSLGIKYYEKEFVYLKKDSVKFNDNKLEPMAKIDDDRKFIEKQIDNKDTQNNKNKWHKE